jgi:hypothetical protein
LLLLLVGMTRFERATTWSQTRRAPKLRYIPLARMAGIEPTTGGFGDRCSTKLSYIRMARGLIGDVWLAQMPRAGTVERSAGVEPASAGVESASAALRAATWPIGHDRAIGAGDEPRTRPFSLED